MSIKDTLPDIKPTLLLDFANTKTLDPRITFGRASSATYYDGKTTAKAEENLFVWSQDFSNGSWSKEFSVITADVTTAPDGTNTADLFAASAVANNHSFYCGAAQPVVFGLSYTTSIYAKANGSNFIQLSWYAAEFSNCYANFDLGAGTVGMASGCTSTITSVGNGWYRCAMTATSASNSSAGRPYISLVTASNSARFESFLGAAQSVYVWGAQFEQRSAATAYTQTTSAPITNYVPRLMTAPAGVPRFDHCPISGRCLGLLLEEARTNQLSNSNDFASQSWVPDGNYLSVVTDQLVAPDGSLAADLVRENSSSGFHRMYRAVSQGSGGDYTVSIFVKAAGRTKFRISEGYSIGGVGVFDLSAGTFSVSSPAKNGAMTAVGNGWFRCSVTWTFTAGAYTVLYLGLVAPDGNNSYQGDGFSGVGLWGAQLEAGAFATSYIPTTTAAVTRQGESAVMTGANFSSWFRADQGTLFAEGQSNAPSSDAGVRFLAAIFNAGSYGNAIRLERLLGTWRDVRTVNDVSAVVSGTWPVGVSGRIAGAYSSAGNVAEFNGMTPSEITSGVPAGLAVLGIGGGVGANQLNGTIKRLAYYPRRLTNPQLQALTA